MTVKFILKKMVFLNRVFICCYIVFSQKDINIVSTVQKDREIAIIRINIQNFIDATFTTCQTAKHQSQGIAHRLSISVY